MSIKRYKAEQIVTLLRQIEVEIANEKTTPQACPVGLWLATSISICRRIATICSGLYFFLAMLQLLSYQFL